MMRISRSQLTPFGQRGSAIFFEGFATVEMTFEIEKKQQSPAATHKAGIAPSNASITYLDFPGIDLPQCPEFSWFDGTADWDSCFGIIPFSANGHNFYLVKGSDWIR
jgi:hypothetical protein